MILKVLQLWWYRKFMHEILEMPSCRLSRTYMSVVHEWSVMCHTCGLIMMVIWSFCFLEYCQRTWICHTVKQGSCRFWIRAASPLTQNLGLYLGLYLVINNRAIELLGHILHVIYVYFTVILGNAIFPIQRQNVIQTKWTPRTKFDSNRNMSTNIHIDTCA